MGSFDDEKLTKETRKKLLLLFMAAYYEGVDGISLKTERKPSKSK